MATTPFLTPEEEARQRNIRMMIAQNSQVRNQNNQVIRLPDATVYPEQFTSPDSNWEPGMGSDYTGTFNGNYITNVPDSPAPNVVPPPTRLDQKRDLLMRCLRHKHWSQHITQWKMRLGHLVCQLTHNIQGHQQVN